MALGCLGFIGLFVVLTFLIIVAAALGGGQQAQDVGQRQQDQPGQQQQQGHQEQEQGRQRQGQQEQKAAYGIADEVNIGNVSYTVTNAKVVKQLKDSFGFDKPLTGNFILITFTFANKGNKPVSLSDLGLYLYDSQGRQYKIDTDAAFYLPEDRSIYLLDRVNPGSSQEVQTVYSVPPDAKGFELEVSSGSFGTETARISLGY
jgi:hypothetical protein